MKRKNIEYLLSIILVLMIIVSACNNKEEIEINKVPEDTNGPVEDRVEEEIDSEKIMMDFNNLIEAKASPEVLVEYIDEHIAKLTEIEGNHMIAELEKLLEKSIQSTKDKISELDENNELVEIAGGELFFSQDNLESIKNDTLREEVSKILNSNYKLMNLEGEINPIINYEDLKKYSENISPELAEYIEIKSMDSQKPLAIDGALYVSYDELAEGILKTEEYIKQYSEGQRYEEMLKAYRQKLIIYLTGIDNSPIYDETGKINEDILESYKKTSNTKDTVTGFIVRKHLETIEEADYIIDESVKNNVLSLVNEALSSLEVTK